MSPLAVVPNVSSIAVISSSAARGGFEVGSGVLVMVHLRSGMKKPPNLVKRLIIIICLSEDFFKLSVYFFAVKITKYLYKR